MRPQPFLHPGNLSRLNEGVAVPSYDRDAVSPGIVHIGMGNFHRAHMAPMMDELLHRCDHGAWSISAVDVLEPPKRLVQGMARQRELYSLTTLAEDGRNCRVIGSVGEFLTLGANEVEVMERLSAPSTRIVTMTITEGGYNVDHDGRFLLEEPHVTADLAGDSPQTVFGLIAHAMRHRMRRGGAPLTVVSCDNVTDNGNLAQHAFTTFAEAWDPKVAAWMRSNMTFPGTMVDRITPSTTSAELDQVEQLLGVRDDCAVTTEPFWQFVVEDDFTSARPAWEDVGAQVVSDVAPFELMKLRLLNASHQLLAQLGLVLGLRYVDEAVSHADLSQTLQEFMTAEAMPSLPDVPGVDLGHYCATLIERFSSRAIRDTLVRIATNSTDRISTFVLPIVRDNLMAGRSIRVCALIVAAWGRRILDPGAMTDIGAVPDSADPVSTSWDEFLSDSRLFGELADSAAFRDAVLAADSQFPSMHP